MDSFALHSLSHSTSFSLYPPPISFVRRRSVPLTPNSPSIPSLPSTISPFPCFPSKTSSTLNPLSELRIANHPIQASSTSSSSSSPALPSSSSPVTQGAKPSPFFISISIGLIVRFLVPKPVEVTPQAWQLLSIFLSTIAGLVLTPLPVGAWAFIGLTVSVVTKTLSFSAAFHAFSHEIIWLIVISFFYARGFVKTGLGDRIATYFVKWLGKSTLGLSYGLIFSEVFIAPALPSTTARAGGVFLPIIKSLSLSAGSEPNHPTSRKLGSYLIQTQFHSAGHSSALFLTASAQNLLCLKLAEELGVIIANPWVTWFKVASLPALVSLLATPLILYKLHPPEMKDTPEAPAMAAVKLENMGPVTRNEWIMIGTMLLAVSLWVFGINGYYIQREHPSVPS
ncbi:hypothetical protein K1719_026289 [Acacia pycnantha]|nr:hypothetical protein K1719_026289 [Acacia pycnantha]